VAGTALLPWEEWLAKLLHPLYVVLRWKLSERRRKKDLSKSKTWPNLDGVIHQIEFDSSLPSEGLRYAYECEKGYYSGPHWRWFERDKPRAVKIGDRIILRYSPEKPEDSVFVDFQGANSSVFSVFYVPEL
jgi:hypothetical protein